MGTRSDLETASSSAGAGRQGFALLVFAFGRLRSPLRIVDFCFSAASHCAPSPIGSAFVAKLKLPIPPAPAAARPQAAAWFWWAVLNFSTSKWKHKKDWINTDPRWAEDWFGRCLRRVFFFSFALLSLLLFLLCCVVKSLPYIDDIIDVLSHTVQGLLASAAAPNCLPK